MVGKECSRKENQGPKERVGRGGLGLYKVKKIHSPQAPDLNPKTNVILRNCRKILLVFGLRSGTRGEWEILTLERL